MGVRASVLIASHGAFDYWEIRDSEGVDMNLPHGITDLKTPAVDATARAHGAGQGSACRSVLDGGRSTSFVKGDGSVVPIPSWPKSFQPQQWSELSPSLMHACPSPTEAAPSCLARAIDADTAALVFDRAGAASISTYLPGFAADPLVNDSVAVVVYSIANLFVCGFAEAERPRALEGAAERVSP